jgi:hypothetical protein
METMRYRSASRVPGTKRLSERDEEVELAKRDDPLGGVAGEDRGVTGAAVATVRVANTSASTACPQMEQKRLFSAISLAQDGHFVIADASHNRTFHDRTAAGRL